VSDHVDNAKAYLGAADKASGMPVSQGLFLVGLAQAHAMLALVEALTPAPAEPVTDLELADYLASIGTPFGRRSMFADALLARYDITRKAEL
jgi:hypothetical protein